VLGVTGDFYTYKDENTGSTVYYTSKKEAHMDGIKATDLTKEHATVNVLDTSNREARQQYNYDTNTYAQKAGVEQKQVRITQSPSQDHIQKNMEIMREYNRKNKIQGIATSRYPKNSKQGDGSKQIYKIYKY
jgi:5,10-methylene-tetrahydrofolate dehydrogenase/methenyl tetrahydrofolate cyclohydrolase